MKNRTGFIARLSGVRRLRLVASVTLCLMAGTGLTILWSLRVTAPLPTLPPAPPLDIAGWTTDAGFTRPALALNGKDRALYHRIFALQANGRWQETDRLIASLDDPLLMGHVLYQRYLVDPAYRSDFTELNHWLQQFGDLPNAERVHRLASRRRNGQDADLVMLKPAAAPLRRPGRLLDGLMKAGVSPQAARPDGVLQLGASQTPRETKQANQLANALRLQLAAGQPAKALARYNAEDKILNHAQRGVLLTQIAIGFYQGGKFSHARLIAQRAQRERGAHRTISSWIAGLAAWQLRDYAAAQSSFARIADNAHADAVDPWFYTAGAYWAARAAGKQGDTAKRAAYLEKAGHYPTTFYGLLAHGALGRAFQPAANNDVKTTFDDATVETLRREPCSERVLALLDIGQKDLATAELQHWLRNRPPSDDRNLRDAMRATAAEFGLAGVQQAVALETEGQNGFIKAVYANDTLFPVLQEAVSTNAAVDPALIHALIRQESRFDPKARNKATGATGLMQLMPETARFIGNGKGSDKTGGKKIDSQKIDSTALQNPATNLALGQRYVDYLLRQPYIKGNLMYLAVAYNAGPGNLQAWQSQIGAEKDPLLFIESLPYGQTRAFVEHVMANYWIYRLRLGHDVADVKQLVDGVWPRHAVKKNTPTIAVKQRPAANDEKTVRLETPKPSVRKPAKPIVEDARLHDRFEVASAR